MAQKPFYITTTLPYVNADPHIGFALEIVHADIQARYQQLVRGRENVFFNTGTDEHGQKIFQKANEQGQDVQAYVDYYAGQFRKLKEGLGLSDDLVFIRTTDEKHIKAAQEMWRRCAANVDEQGNPDIYKKKYKGLYCVGDEMFLKEGDLIGGKCPNHPNMEPVEIEEENWFFRLSRYQSQLLTYLSNASVVLPDWRREEAIKFVEGGLEDFSISRETARMSWGIPVPGDESQVMYVWFDALTNYISTLDWPSSAEASAGEPASEGLFEKFWVNGETVQVAGKDQVRFQSVMWQAMLMSAKLPQTQKVVYHGFITSGGQKMSKSLGNVIEPFAIVQEYGVDALRYYLARHISPFEDSDFTMERFKELYNADLANGLGNLAARIMTMTAAHFATSVEIIGAVKNDSSVAQYVSDFELNKAMDAIWTRIGHCDAMITLEKPFTGVKSNDEQEKQKALEIIQKLARELHAIASDLAPFMPTTSEKILTAIRENKKPENLFPRKE